MTYVPVSEENRKGIGRTPLEIPEALLSQLRHSDATGARCVLDLDGTENPDDIAELKRQLVRAGYRHFPGKTIYKRFTEEQISYWVAEKRKRGNRA